MIAHFKTILVVLLFFSITVDAEVVAQLPSVSGSVFQSASAKTALPSPWPELRVYLYNGHHWIGPSITDPYGRYAFAGIAPGDYLMRIYLNKELKWEQEVKAPVNILPIVLSPRLLVSSVAYSFHTEGHAKDWSTRVDIELKCGGVTVGSDSGHNVDKKLDKWPRHSSQHAFKLPIGHSLFSDDISHCTYVIAIVPKGYDKWAFDAMLSFTFSNGLTRSFFFPSLELAANDRRAARELALSDETD